MGTLYIVGTPIGNLEDITLRALRILQEVPLIAAEDTRKAKILLSHYAIKTPLTSFFEGNEQKKVAVLLEALDQGDVALISEAGMPGISDPGYSLIRAALEAGIPVVPVPGPSAHTAALVASGLPTDRFLFLGFLPRKPADQKAFLAKVAGQQTTLVCYESPRRVRATLEVLHQALGNRPVALCREMTKLYEEVWRGDLEGALAHLEEAEPRGEFTLVVGGATEAAGRWELSQVRAALEARLREGLPRSQAAREVAAAAGWSRREVYEVETER
ncbi:MAG: 16S rRNA (cytidine(1402)-2'-O)-methyltransferase [Anaerolineae bacterium]|jgi:16S rRNA (cytidine1402-2'-O)-methyltransferase|nr:16S rRNA (cytidine(1402)-2'-O)-methyltransferase [Anaerolineae bacterium]